MPSFIRSRTSRVSQTNNKDGIAQTVIRFYFPKSAMPTCSQMPSFIRSAASRVSQNITRGGKTFDISDAGLFTNADHAYLVDKLYNDLST